MFLEVYWGLNVKVKRIKRIQKSARLLYSYLKQVISDKLAETMIKSVYDEALLLLVGQPLTS